MVWIEPGRFVMGNNKGHKDKASGRFEAFPDEKGGFFRTATIRY